MTTLADVVSVLDRAYPPETAQSWDRVGLVSGDLGAVVRRVRCAIDPTQAVIERAAADGVDLLVTHHPLLLRGVSSIAPSVSAKGRAVTSLVRSGLGLYAAHTNADAAAGGVSDALADALGLTEVEPLTQEEGHPLGRVGTLPEVVTLAALASRLARVLPAAAGGIRVSGDRKAKVRRVAVMGGAGDSGFEAARASGADVYVTADLRHHPALEDREASGGGAPFLVDAGHWATESLWLPRVKALLDEAFGSTDRPDRVETDICTLRTDPWTFTVGAEPPGGDA